MTELSDSSSGSLSPQEGSSPLLDRYSKLAYLREAAGGWPEPNRYTVACDEVADLIAAGEALVIVLSMQDKAQREGFAGENHRLAVAAASMQFEKALLALQDDGIPL